MVVAVSMLNESVLTTLNLPILLLENTISLPVIGGDKVKSTKNSNHS